MIPEIFTPTPYYTNKEQAKKDREQLFEDSKNAYIYAREENYDKVNLILTNWASLNKGVGNREGEFLFLFRGHLFIKAYQLSSNQLSSSLYRNLTFENWMNSVLYQCASKLYLEKNNTGAWAILNAILIDHLKGKNLTNHHQRIYDFISNSSTIEGKMWRETKRTNSGIFYSYFALAPLLEACYVSGFDNIWLLHSRLEWLYQYAVNPESWPYRPKTGFLGWIESLMYPHAEELELPHCWGWPGNLYKVAGELFSNDRWKRYACTDKFINEDIFLYGELM